MWTHKLLSVLVLVSIGQANSFHQQKISNENEGDKPDGLYVLQDADDARRAFVVTRESTPNSVKLNAGFQLFEIPIGPQFSYSREKDVSEVDPTATRKEPAKSGWKYFPFSRAFTDDINEENDQDEVVQVPAGKLKQQQNVGIIEARDADSGTFPWRVGVRSERDIPDDRHRRDDGTAPWGLGVRSERDIPDDRHRRDDGTAPWGLGVRTAGAMSDDEIRKNELATDKLSAGLQIFGLPLGPQFSYNSNKEDDGSGDKGDILTSLLAPILTNIAKRWVAEYILG